MADQYISPQIGDSPFTYRPVPDTLNQVDSRELPFYVLKPNVAVSNFGDNGTEGAKLNIIPENDNYLKQPMPIYLASSFTEEVKIEGKTKRWIRSGTKVKPADDYFKDNGALPEYEYEGGEFSEITYAFDRVRLVPAVDSTGARQRVRVGERIINGAWNLVADLHGKFTRYIQFPEKPLVSDATLDSSSPFYNEDIANDVYRPFEQILTGIVQKDVVLATSKLIYRTRKCPQTAGKPDGIDYEWYFEVDDIELLANLTIKQQSSRPGTVPILDDFGDEIGTEGILVSLADRIRNQVSIGDDTSRVVFTPDGKLESHKRPIAQHVVWANHKRKLAYIGEEQSVKKDGTPSPVTTLFLEPPLGFYGQDNDFSVETDAEANMFRFASVTLDKLYIYYGLSTPPARGNDNILVARTVVLDENSDDEKLDTNWLNFDTPPAGKDNFQNNDKGLLDFFGMYVKFIDWEWIPEWGSPSFAYQAEKYWVDNPDGSRSGPFYRTSRYQDEAFKSGNISIVNSSTTTAATSLAGGLVNASTAAVIPPANAFYRPTEWVKPLDATQVAKGMVLWYGGNWDQNRFGQIPPGQRTGPGGFYFTPWICIKNVYPGSRTLWVNPYTVLENGTGYPPNYTGPKDLEVGTQLDKHGNILKPIPNYFLGNRRSLGFVTDKAILAGSSGCPPLSFDRKDMWIETSKGLVLAPTFRFGTTGFANDAYASIRAYLEIENQRARNMMNGNTIGGFHSLNPAYIIPTDNYDDDRKFFVPYGPNPQFANYFFRDIRFVPTYDIERDSRGRIKNRTRTIAEVNNRIIPGPWNLIADLYMYIPTYRDLLNPSFGTIRQFVGILYPDYVFAKGQLVTSINQDCEDLFDWNSVKYEYRFSVSEINSLLPLSQGYAHHANNIRSALTGADRTKRYKMGLPGLKPGDPVILDRQKDYELSFTNGETRISLINHILKQNAYEEMNNRHWQPYRQENEKYWSYSFGNLPVLIDQEPKGVFGKLVLKDAVSKYVVPYDITLFKNKVIGETPCTQSSYKWDFREEYPKGPDTDLASDVKPEYVNCEDAVWIPYSSNPFIEPKEFVDPAFQGEGATTENSPIIIGFVPKITKIKNEELSETIRTRDPLSPCYQGFKTVYDITEYYEVTHSKECWTDASPLDEGQPNVIFDGFSYKRYNGFFSGSIEYVTTTQTVWEKPERIMCDCIEIKVAGTPIIDPDDPCGCREIYIDNIYEICLDDGLYYYENQIIPPNKLPKKTETRFSVSIDCNKVDVKVHHKINPETDILYAKEIIENYPMFNNSDSPDCYITSSMQRSSSYQYHRDVVGCHQCDTYSPYFAVSYGNINGSGSIQSSFESNDSPSRAVYSRYRLLTQESPTTKFSFYTNGTLDQNVDEIYTINFYSEYAKDGIDPGNFELSLAELNGRAYANNVFTGSNVQISSSKKIITLIDTSNDLRNEEFCSTSPYTSFDIVSGSLVNGYYNTSSLHTYGTIYPLLNLVVLDGKKLRNELSFNSVTGSNIDGDNSSKIFTSISGAAALNSPIRARKAHKKIRTEYLLKIKHMEANYSNNPTFVVSNNALSQKGKIKNECFDNEPITYITAIGFYNDQNELVAIGKPSKPIIKTPNDEVYLKITIST